MDSNKKSWLVGKYFSNHGADPVVYFGFIFLAVASFFVNAMVFYTVLQKYLERKSRRRNVLLLIAHWAVLAFLVPFLNCFVSSDNFHIIEFDSSKCRLISYLKTVVLCSYSINMMAIVHDLVGSFHRDWLASSTPPVFRTFCIQWLIPIVFSVPTWWMIQPKEEYIARQGLSLGNTTLPKESIKEHCVSVPLMDSEIATVGFESVRLLLNYVVVTVCMIVAIFHIRSKMNFLRQFCGQGHQNRIQRQARSVRLIYFYLSSVVFLWLPSGIVIFYRRILPRLDVNDRSAEKRNTIGKILASFSVVAYVSMCPLITLLFIEIRHKWSLVCSRIISRFAGHGNAVTKETTEDGGKRAVSNDFKDTAEHDGVLKGNTSRYSTIGFTTVCHSLPTTDLKPIGIVN